MMPQLYRLLTWLLTPVLLLFTWQRILRRPVYRAHWQERFGWVPRRQDRPLWIHAVSVGEGMAALPLIRQLRERHPDLPILVTSTTPTGRTLLARELSGMVAQAYLPYDLPGAVQRFLERSQPRLGVLMETELWPGLLGAARQRGIPMMLLNGRLSARSLAGYRRFASLFAPALAGLDWVGAQSSEDAQRFAELGATDVRIQGQMKLDLQIGSGSRERAALWRERFAGRRVWVFASTHPGEEELAWNSLPTLRKIEPQLLLVLIPRHPERGDALAEQLRSIGLSASRRSQRQFPGPDDPVYLVDTLGELIDLYGAADLVWIGGSFVARGGHNPIEAAAWGKPIIVGPHMENFFDTLRSLQAADGICQVASAEEATRHSAEYLAAPKLARALGERAATWQAQQGGPVARALAAIEERL
ncbi:3-deoxy-D-manno-octulosonic acid transferase [Acidithiobacillus sp. AMEEHan]|uniref:3-deoxy-D-manno-octulosonic acid transferase n=1 Tax=Acidithiobacillus sp. AMEEHan TaxID=2994951 RepID=UPI0027E4886E|nr:3-deoxy-D-manno-octulosonic acid transferase [Acidithiobacillus sp. AMEEHan]